MQAWLLLVQGMITTISSALAGWYLVPSIRAVAYAKNIIDNPDGNLKRHKEPTPYLGGVVVMISAALGLLIGCFDLITYSSLSVVLLASMLMLCVGLFDDMLPLSPHIKFLLQVFVVVLCSVHGIVYAPLLAFMPSIVARTVTLFFMLSVINGFNLIDVMDGLAATTGILISVMIASAAWCYGAPDLLLESLALCGALIGFLYWNRPPARIYLGDAGSLFIGTVTVLLMCLMPATDTLTSLMIPPFIFAVPLLEVTFLIVIRAYKRIPFYNGSPDHFSIYLRQRHWSIGDVLQWTALYSSGLFGGVILCLFYTDAPFMVTLYGIGLTFFWFLVVIAPHFLKKPHSC